MYSVKKGDELKSEKEQELVCLLCGKSTTALKLTATAHTFGEHLKTHTHLQNLLNNCAKHDPRFELIFKPTKQIQYPEVFAFFTT